MNVDV